MEGLNEHIQRHSYFPDLEKEDNDYLININGVCAVQKPRKSNTGVAIKKIAPDNNGDLKWNRQGRLVVIEDLNGMAEGVFVWNVGEQETGLHVKGLVIKNYLDKLVEYHADCEKVKWNEYENLKTIYREKRAKESGST
jgi:hypothetical protein